MSETLHKNFLEMPGNPYIEDAESSDDPTTKALLAVAYELRTQTLIMSRLLADSVSDEAIARRVGFTTIEE